MPSDTLRILAVCAHPDDADLKFGGLATKYANAGQDVRFVSLTNGDAGHHEIGGVELARRRRAEAQASADVIGIEYDVRDVHDGKLEPTLANRTDLIRLIRRYEPDLVVTHRPNDYHPDHRYTSTLVQDAAYMVTVPNVCTDVPALREDPVICYLSDGFQRPAPFEPDVIVPIDDVLETKLEMLHQHASQFYEWLPYNDGKLESVPDEEDERWAWIQAEYLSAFNDDADRFRDALVERYGEERGQAVDYAESVQECEYGAPLTAEARDRLFPFE
jgi:LmbE family N-acetylglucosaminyl deacetylase